MWEPSLEHVTLGTLVFHALALALTVVVCQPVLFGKYWTSETGLGYLGPSGHCSTHRNDRNT